MGVTHVPECMSGLLTCGGGEMHKPQFYISDKRPKALPVALRQLLSIIHHKTLPILRYHKSFVASFLFEISYPKHIDHMTFSICNWNENGLQPLYHMMM